MQKETILVADDNDDMRHIIADGILGSNGYNTITAANGRETLQMVYKHRPDLLLLDFHMPQLNGVQVLEHLANRNFEIPAIFMTAHGDEWTAVDVMRLGVRDYLIKPFLPDELLDVVDRCLEQVRAERENEILLNELRAANFYLRRRMDELEILQSITEGLSEGYLKRRMVETACLLTDSEEALLYLYQGGKLICQAHKSPDADIAYVSNDVRDDPLAMKTIREQKLEIVSQEGDTWLDALAMPILQGKQCIGAIVIKNYSSKRAPYNAQDSLLMKSLANYAATAIDREPMRTMELPELHIANLARPKKKRKRIFVSYSREDYREYVKPLVDRLKLSGFEVWLDQDVIGGGQDWLEEINFALSDCHCLIACISPTAIQSKYVKMEYRYFIQEDKPILPVMCRPTPNLPAELRAIQHLPYNDMAQVVDTLRDIFAQADNPTGV